MPGAMRQIAVYENALILVLFRSAIWPFRLAEPALQVGRAGPQVGRGLVPRQPCFGVLTAGTRESIRSPERWDLSI